MRKQYNNDSLELMLDTICNIFGGMILMAILVIIQTQVTAGRIDDTPEQEDAKLINNKLQFECERLIEDINYKKQKQIDLKSRFDLLSKDTVPLIKSNQEIDSALKISEDKITAVDKLLAEISLQKNKGNNAISEMQKEIVNLETDIQYKHSEIERIEKNNKQVRLPFQHNQQNASFCYFLIYGDKAYYIESIIADDSPSDSGHCTIVSVGSGGVLVTPIKGEGFVVREDTMPGGFVQIINKSNSVGLFVCADNESFNSFQQLKNFILEKGFLYSVAAYNYDDGLILSFTDNVSVE